jgi:hypothetical protein
VWWCFVTEKNYLLLAGTALAGNLFFGCYVFSWEQLAVRFYLGLLLQFRRSSKVQRHFRIEEILIDSLLTHLFLALPLSVAVLQRQSVS